MRRSTGNTPLTCSECGTPTTEPRRGLCQKCYLAEYNGRLKKKACECCGYADPRVLVRRRLDGASWFTLCGNCAQIAGKRKMTLEDLQAEVSPEEDRRVTTAVMDGDVGNVNSVPSSTGVFGTGILRCGGTRSGELVNRLSMHSFVKGFF